VKIEKRFAVNLKVMVEQSVITSCTERVITLSNPGVVSDLHHNLH
jgi:hypothetical protein